ncbi:tryptophan synthase subunit beta [Spirochaeta thermophila]|uniref:Tryptophan synthase beta chain n=1 Tax=Winmispira thermophila (strain ATCC 49972 / DSM 6192 / RI 19.B1) TaxID=665571 RepID=E0RNF8_WINT6|nr:tryptophan synthase subunit beta [Spirochaeta thermophila]ADN01158.1 tryptophan synthase beta chain [Spirochaeta thermophila DSM 6192]
MQKVYNDFFGTFGGRYVAEVLRCPLDELEQAFLEAMADPSFHAELAEAQRHFVGRPTPLMYAENATRALGGSRIYIKLEGLANTGAHKINNALGQALLAKRMGKRRIIAETGAGQHGVATASVCARLGLECTVYMGEVDMARQRPNVYLMELFGAKVVPVRSGSRTLKDAVNEALRDWAASWEDTHYLLGSALGPSPFPDMVREFQSVVGREVVEQIREQVGEEVEALVACVGGGSNAIGFFAPFIEADRPKLIGVEAGGRGNGPGEHAARMSGAGVEGVVHGYKSLFLLDEDGQVLPTHSISAGLDYPGIGPQLAYLGRIGRIRFTTASDAEALEALKFFARHEGVVFALESAHAGAVAMKMAREGSPDKAIIVNMSGRGDKDIFITAKAIDGEKWREFLLREASS